MNTSELLADCERMLSELERIGKEAKKGEMVIGEWKPVSCRVYITEPGKIQEIAIMADAANAVAVCRWKRIAERHVKRWRKEVQDFVRISKEGDILFWIEEVDELHAELKEATDGE